MARWPRTPAHWVGLLAAAALIPFVVIDVINLELWNAGWDIWGGVAGFTVLFLVIAYGLGWGLARVVIWIFRKVRSAF